MKYYRLNLAVNPKLVDRAKHGAALAVAAFGKALRQLRQLIVFKRH